METFTNNKKYDDTLDKKTLRKICFVRPEGEFEESEGIRKD